MKIHVCVKKVKTRLRSQRHTFAKLNAYTAKKREVKNNVALAHPYHLSSGVWEDIVTDRRKIMLLSHTINMRGSHVASLVKFRLVVKEEKVWRSNLQTDGLRCSQYLHRFFRGWVGREGGGLKWQKVGRFFHITVGLFDTYRNNIGKKNNE